MPAPPDSCQRQGPAKVGRPLLTDSFFHHAAGIHKEIVIFSLCRRSFRGILGLAGVLLHVELAKVIVEHPPDQRLLFQAVPREVETDSRARRAHALHEIIIWVGFDNQFRFVHAHSFPQDSGPALPLWISN
jgi:hypothetical protein